MNFGCDYLPSHFVSVWIFLSPQSVSVVIISTAFHFHHDYRPRESIWLRTLFIANLMEWTAPNCKSVPPFLAVIVEGPNVGFKLSLQYLTLLLKIMAKSQPMPEAAG
jgi:hypothetical protein